MALDRERSYAILAYIADGIVAVDRGGDVVLWNAAAERITGVPATEAVGRTIPAVLGRDLQGDGTAQSERLLAITRGPEDVWLSVTEAVMHDPGGAVAGRHTGMIFIENGRFHGEKIIALLAERLRRD